MLHARFLAWRCGKECIIELAGSYSFPWIAKELGLHFEEAILVEMAAEQILGLDLDMELIDSLYGELTRAETLTQLVSQDLVVEK